MISLFDQGPPPPCPVPFNMAAYVLSSAQSLGEKPALIIMGAQSHETWSFAQILRAVQGTATGLCDAGLIPGDRILMRLGNRVEFPIAYLAAIYAGLIPVPTSAMLTGPEITRIAGELRPAAILSEDGVAIPANTPAMIIALDQLRAMQTLPPADPVMGDPDRLAYIIYTSGTSGRARGVCHAHRAIWARRMMFEGWYGLHAQDRVMHAGAFNWTYTLGTGLMDPWTMGATALIPAPGTPPAALPDLMCAHHATIFAAAPGVYRQMLKQSFAPIPTLRHGLSAGEKLSPDTAQCWRDTTGTDVHEALGMSEVSTFISGSPSRAATPPASGYPQTGRRIAVLGADQTPVPIGHPGTLAVSTRDPGVMLGYLGDAPITGDWFITGDTVSMSQDHAITYLGRTDDMMNAGGYRVSPHEVEAAFAPLLDDIACVDVEIKPGARVIALFYAAANPMDNAELNAHAQANLARYKQPRLYIHISDMPKGANGKLNRRLLRDNFEARDDKA